MGNDHNQEQYPEGHFIGMWIGIGIAIFTGVGVPVSVATDNLAFLGIGPAIGVAFGAAIGTSLQAKYSQEGKIRPLTEDEQRKRKLGIKISIGLLILGIITLLIFALS